MGHHCCNKQKVKRGLWSPEEDEKLIRHITSHGHGCWSSVPKLAGLQRCGKSCRLRWINYLRPDLKRGSFTEQEEAIIIDVHRILGNRWAQIAKHLPGRTDNEVKNFWNSCIKKKLIAQGLDPNTHNLLSSHNTSNNTTTKLSHTHQKPTSSLFSISTTSHRNDAHCVDLKTTPFVTLPSSFPPHSDANSTNVIPTSLYENSTTTSTTTTTTATIDFQNTNFISDFRNKSMHSSMEFASQSSMLPPSSMNISSGFGGLDENPFWSNNIEQFESMRPEHQPQEQQQQLHENECNGGTGNVNEHNMENSLIESSNFDFEFMESTLMPCGMYCNVSDPMDELAWDC